MALAPQTNTATITTKTTKTELHKTATPFTTSPFPVEVDTIVQSSDLLELPLLDDQIEDHVEKIDEKNLSTSISKTWTEQAIKCHLTKADCANCSVMRGNYSFTCQMNKVVPILLEVLGEPDPDRVEKVRPYAYD